MSTTRSSQRTVRAAQPRILSEACATYNPVRVHLRLHTRLVAHELVHPPCARTSVVWLCDAPSAPAFGRPRKLASQLRRHAVCRCTDNEHDANSAPPVGATDVFDRLHSPRLANDADTGVGGDQHPRFLHQVVCKQPRGQLRRRACNGISPSGGRTPTS